jgi:adenosylhomocysteine nucleosidase
MIAIVAAMDQELGAILATAHEQGEVRTQSVAGRELHFATLDGHDVVLALSGVGKVAAAATAAVLAQRADAMIMVGSAGGLGEQVNPGDVIVATELLQHDLDARPLWDRWVTPALGISRIPTDPTLRDALAAAAQAVCREHRPDLAALGLTAPASHTGLIISGDIFVATVEGSQVLRAALPDALAVEMEGAALAQVCHAAGVPFAVARTISDRADHNAALDFSKFLPQVAAPYARDLVRSALMRL